LSGIPRPPEQPHPDECCHRGCEPCIFDYYDTAMERWRARVEALGLDPDRLLAQLRSES
jgi:hypothetical protein